MYNLTFQQFKQFFLSHGVEENKTLTFQEHKAFLTELREKFGATAFQFAMDLFTPTGAALAQGYEDSSKTYIFDTTWSEVAEDFRSLFSEDEVWLSNAGEREREYAVKLFHQKRFPSDVTLENLLQYGLYNTSTDEIILTVKATRFKYRINPQVRLRDAGIREKEYARKLVDGKRTMSNISFEQLLDYATYDESTDEIILTLVYKEATSDDKTLVLKWPIE